MSVLKKKGQFRPPIKVTMIDPKTNTVVATYKSIREAERANYLGQATLHHQFKKGHFDYAGFKWILGDN